MILHIRQQSEKGRGKLCAHLLEAKLPKGLDGVLPQRGSSRHCHAQSTPMRQFWPTDPPPSHLLHSFLMFESHNLIMTVKQLMIQ